MPEPFVWEDAWILLAVLYSAGRDGNYADTAQIKHAADYIQHAIPTRAELECAFHRLESVGLIEIADEKYRPSAEVLRNYERTTTPRRPVFKELDDMEQFLKVQPKE